jgi:predicted nucleotidyltransferase component of viral defense system
MIPQRNLSLISNDLAAGGARRIPESIIERDYCLAWFLTGLAGHPLRETVAFKGGTALRRCWFPDYRFSEDLDFTMTREITFAEILAGLKEISDAVERASGLRIVFDREDPQSHANCHTFYLRYRGPLPAENDVKVDITIREQLCFPLEDRRILRSYDGYNDLPDGPTVRVYSLQEVTIEKLAALSDRARNEPRDLFDLWYLLTSAGIQLGELRPELNAKLAFRNRTAVGIEEGIAEKEERLRRLWIPRLAQQMNDLPPFERVFRELQRAVRAAGLPPRT